MPVYVYDGRTARGTKISGQERMAESKAALTALLRRERITPTKIKEKGKEFALPILGGQKITAKELAIFFRQFSVMIDSGLPLVQCLEILAGNQENTAFQKVLTDVRSHVESGTTLANAMREHPKTFDQLMVNMIEAGETGGILDTILQRLAGYVEKAVKLRAAVKSALIYPVAVLGIAGIVITMLLWKVVPIFANMFAAMGVELPLPTKIVVGMSSFIGRFGWVFIILGIFAFFGFKRVYASEGGRYTIDRIMLRIPVIGDLLRKIAVARFTRTLGTLITSGVPLLESMSITARTSGNAVVERAIMAVRKAIEEGRTITEPLKESGVFPNMVTQMIAVGEQTGAMDAMLQKIADFYEMEVDDAVKNMLTLLEPVIIAFLGATVGGIVVAMYMPMFELIAKMSG
ncbi:MAG: pilus assembly protein PilC [Acidobacteria bacterium RIFCSPLOWO2_02_FULL_61_28]|nr:MAG: pilus assembly protein PilC [Acidobacteria bacterium RIFCSPLOWO2_02_FULL_61_28]